MLDDYSRFIIAWRLYSAMLAEDVSETLDMDLAASGCDKMHIQHRPRLLSDNGPSHIPDQLADFIKAKAMSHFRGAPLHPRTQGKIERWHQTFKNRILLENYFLPGDREQQIEAFVEHYNHQRDHERLHNVTSADAYFGRAAAITRQRERIKRKPSHIGAFKTVGSPPKYQTSGEAHAPLVYAARYAKCSDNGHILLLSEGQMSDYKSSALMIEAFPRAKVLLGDGSYEVDWFCHDLTKRGINPCIPSNTNRKMLIQHDRARYRQKYRVENMFDKIKVGRRIYTRYDLCAHICIFAICIAATVIL